MLKLVGSSVEGSESLFSQTLFLEDIVKLLEAMNREDFEAFVALLERVDLNGIYNHEKFPQPQLLSRFLLLYFLGFIDEGKGESFSNRAEWIIAILEKKPDLTFLIGDGYPFLDFIKNRREFLIQELDAMSNRLEETGESSLNDLLRKSYEKELFLLELIAEYL